MPLLDKQARSKYNKEYYNKSKCPHNKPKNHCLEWGGGSICQHKTQKTRCVECGGGSVCQHKKQRTRCVECGGGSICHHNKRKDACTNRLPTLKYLILLQRSRINQAIRSGFTKSVIEYLGCDVEYFKQFIEKKMTDSMTWDNIHIDHIKPISKFNLDTFDEFLSCCHYTNFQPLLAQKNVQKNSQWNNQDEKYWYENIRGHDEHINLYLPVAMTC